jgi:urocanate hydratase
MQNVTQIKAPIGRGLSCKGWHQEAMLRLLMNSLDFDLGEEADPLSTSFGVGQIARDWECYYKILETLRRLENDETLLLQAGKPVGVFTTHLEAPRLLALYSDFSAAVTSWVSTGSQGVIQECYEIFSACAEAHFDGDLAGRFVLTAGLGRSGGAQPVAVTMLGGVCLAVEIDAARVERCVDMGYCDLMCWDLTEAIDQAIEAKIASRPLSIALVGNIAEVLPELVRRCILPDVITDQTSSYVPADLSLLEAASLRDDDPLGYEERALDSMASQVEAMLEMRRRGSVVFDYGNNLRSQVAEHRGMDEALEIPSFVTEYLRPLFSQGAGPFRWVALSGDPADIDATDQVVLAHISDKSRASRWIHQTREKIRFQGLPARACWLDYHERAEMGQRFNWLVKEGLVSAPIVISRDQFDGGAIASPEYETREMRDGSDAVADWPLLNALLNASCGATCVSVHRTDQALYSGMVCVADGTVESDRRLQRLLTCDPATGVMRYADAGYPEAIAEARQYGIDLPLITDPSKEECP